VADKTQKPHSAKWWGEQVKQWQTIRLSSGALVQAARIRGREVITQAYYRPGPERWLVIEKLEDETIRYFVSNAPESVSLKQLVLWAHARWAIEQSYQQLKEELGLNHLVLDGTAPSHHVMLHGLLLFAAVETVKKSPNSRFHQPDAYFSEPLAFSPVHVANAT
jgi:SRSO17 transposase